MIPTREILWNVDGIGRAVIYVLLVIPVAIPDFRSRPSR